MKNFKIMRLKNANDHSKAVNFKPDRLWSGFRESTIRIKTLDPNKKSRNSPTSLIQAS
ncbi:hypothetical protein [Dubosiella newyorkensis]|uniref:hypothetical protein n=1 Tax=Dubosiella newyorkensis TaxID=1862672 RepID=UPI003F66BECF